MRRKFWPKAPAEEGALGLMTKNFQVYFIPINFFKKPNKKNLQYSQRFILRSYYICSWFFYCLLVRKKWNLKHGPWQPTLPYWLIGYLCFHGFPSWGKTLSGHCNEQAWVHQGRRDAEKALWEGMSLTRLRTIGRLFTRTDEIPPSPTHLGTYRGDFALKTTKYLEKATTSFRTIVCGTLDEWILVLASPFSTRSTWLTNLASLHHFRFVYWLRYFQWAWLFELMWWSDDS